MQNEQELSQPVWIVTQAAYGSSRTAVSGLDAPSGDGASRISVTGPSVRACRSSAGARARLCVPNTTSTQPTRC